MNSANMTPVAENDYSLEELQKEARMGAFGQETFEREVRVIDLSNFEQRKYEIADQLWSAATDIGFFQVSNHGIPLEQIQTAFEMTQQFFNLPESIKARYPIAMQVGKVRHRFVHRPAHQTKKSLIKLPAHVWKVFILVKRNYLILKIPCWSLNMHAGKSA